MLSKTNIQTERLILRQWCEEDLEPFAALNSDPRVMEYFPAILTRDESDQLIKRLQTKIEENGWGLWAASLKEDEKFIGFIGLAEPNFNAHFTPAVEVGWRLASSFWGKGYATEGALACLKYGFEKLHLEEIVSFTTVQNMRSRAVMVRIGMHHNPEDDFDHPKLSKEHKLSKHVLYRIEKDEWRYK